MSANLSEAELAGAYLSGTGRRMIIAVPISEGDLHPAGEGLKMLAHLCRSGGVQLVDLAVLELQVKPDKVVWVPAEGNAEYLL